ncbi:transcription elongation factor GreA [Brevibacterium sp. HMSC08F02]|uniref:Transcription elongation factor GreA n=1 Tax=Brevibacterium ravenspurgense TaxID=479117 RepID=A0A150HCP7_9MICO|nr:MULTISPECIES: transcription elongation factor GreA [Brevibacterium]KXZ59430.1 Transcription elongation factor GreA [Brevibacterium ravenspurgense]OFT26641.1 transcription elongation factor GreA [Brevibacterium sp. HMSC08F02]OFT91855.1 transcription elongation factor GreA [Brevibacterium sp. HMSC24B04]OFT95560.1 transcription elongation factor GreA [Brevibacterium sp. HMSC22B09]PKY69547.1 transcription elongation factor GreA [Brevibacterium ravenspurgense]
MAEENVGDKTWLTKEAHERLTKELEHLQGPGRAEIAERIDAAREEGDLKENGGYHAARDEQGQMEARIRQLEELLRNAEVGEADADDKIAGPGKLIVVEMNGRKMEFLLGSREIISEEDKVEVFSEQSPLGKAVNGAKVGDDVEYEAPNGRKITVTVKSAKAY